MKASGLGSMMTIHPTWPKKSGASRTPIRPTGDSASFSISSLLEQGTTWPIAE